MLYIIAILNTYQMSHIMIEKSSSGPRSDMARQRVNKAWDWCRLKKSKVRVLLLPRGRATKGLPTSLIVESVTVQDHARVAD